MHIKKRSAIIPWKITICYSVNYDDNRFYALQQFHFSNTEVLKKCWDFNCNIMMMTTPNEKKNIN